MPVDTQATGMETPTSPLPRSPRYRSLDIWRGVACLMVIVYHSTHYAAATPLSHTASIAERLAAHIIGFTTRLHVGVALFFLISGYCISASADTLRRRPGSVGSYFLRRFRRIYPPYWAILVLIGSVVALTEGLLWPGLFADHFHAIPKVQDLDAWQWLGNVTLTEMWRYHIGGSRGLIYLSPAWTLCYEEQFYAAIGLLLWLTPRHFFAAVAALTGLTFLARAGAAWMDVDIKGFFFDENWSLFAAGVYLYYQINYLRMRGQAIGFTVLGIGAVVAFCLGKGGIFIPVVLLAFLLLNRWDERIAAHPLLRPLAMCGGICYSLYLVHFLIVKGLSHALFEYGVQSNLATLLLTVPACLAGSLVVGWAFYCCVESRFLNSPPAARSQRTAAATEIQSARFKSNGRETMLGKIAA